MNSEDLIAKVLAAREFWVDVEPAADGRPVKRVRVRRPPRAELPRLRTLQVEHFVSCAVGWDGFTEADLLPPGIGGNSVVPFDAELFAVVARDKPWLEKLMSAVIDAATTFLASEKAAEKN
jgi:hypothetical protein